MDLQLIDFLIVNYAIDSVFPAFQALTLIRHSSILNGEYSAKMAIHTKI